MDDFEVKRIGLPKSAPDAPGIAPAPLARERTRVPSGDLPMQVGQRLRAVVLADLAENLPSRFRERFGACGLMESEGDRLLPGWQFGSEPHHVTGLEALQQEGRHGIVVGSCPRAKDAYGFPRAARKNGGLREIDQRPVQAGEAPQHPVGAPRTVARTEESAALTARRMGLCLAAIVEADPCPAGRRASCWASETPYQSQHSFQFLARAASAARRLACAAMMCSGSSSSAASSKSR